MTNYSVKKSTSPKTEPPRSSSTNHHWTRTPGVLAWVRRGGSLLTESAAVITSVGDGTTTSTNHKTSPSSLTTTMVTTKPTTLIPASSSLVPHSYDGMWWPSILYPSWTYAATSSGFMMPLANDEQENKNNINENKKSSTTSPSSTTSTNVNSGSSSNNTSSSKQTAMMIRIEGCKKPVAVHHLAKNMVPQKVALASRPNNVNKASTTPRGGSKKGEMRRVVAYYLGLDSYKSKIPNWAAIDPTSAKPYRVNALDILSSYHKRVGHADWKDLMNAMEEASGALLDNKLHPKELLVRMMVDMNDNDDCDDNNNNANGVGETPEYYDDWKSQSLSQSQKLTQFSQGLSGLGGTNLPLQNKDSVEKETMNNKEEEKQMENKLERNEKSEEEEEKKNDQNDEKTRLQDESSKIDKRMQGTDGQVGDEKHPISSIDPSTKMDGGGDNNNEGVRFSKPLEQHCSQQSKDGASKVSKSPQSSTLQSSSQSHLNDNHSVIHSSDLVRKEYPANNEKEGTSTPTNSNIEKELVSLSKSESDNVPSRHNQLTSTVCGKSSSTLPGINRGHDEQQAVSQTNDDHEPKLKRSITNVTSGISPLPSKASTRETLTAKVTPSPAVALASRLGSARDSHQSEKHGDNPNRQAPIGTTPTDVSGQPTRLQFTGEEHEHINHRTSDSDMKGKDTQSEKANDTETMAKSNGRNSVCTPSSPHERECDGTHDKKKSKGETEKISCHELSKDPKGESDNAMPAPKRQKICTVPRPNFLGCNGNMIFAGNEDDGKESNDNSTSLDESDAFLTQS